MAGDPLMEMVSEFVEERIDFDLVRRPDQRGARILGIVRRDELIDEIRSSCDVTSYGGTVSQLKKICPAVMIAKGRPLQAEVEFEGKKHKNVFKNCAIRLPDDHRSEYQAWDR